MTTALCCTFLYCATAFHHNITIINIIGRKNQYDLGHLLKFTFPRFCVCCHEASAAKKKRKSTDIGNSHHGLESNSNKGLVFLIKSQKVEPQSDL